MRIAIADDKGMIANVFANAESYVIFDDGVYQESIEGSFNGARFIADYFSIKKIDNAIGKNMGEDLANELKTYKIGCFLAENMTTNEAAKLFFQNNLPNLIPNTEFNDNNLSSCNCF